MNTTQLEYFVSVGSCTVLQKAAQKHYVSQTAVTQIQNLEEILNTTLFDRTKRPIQLTDEGTMLLTDAKSDFGADVRCCCETVQCVQQRRRFPAHRIYKRLRAQQSVRDTATLSPGLPQCVSFLLPSQ